MDNISNQVIKGYELKERIGAGGFGQVYRAYQPIIGREVAIKVILPQYANEVDFIRRFEIEAQLVARLEHPHIVPLYDYWRDPKGAYLVMRWLQGNLRNAIQAGPWSVVAVARLLDQIAAALAIAHREGIVHRDIKPDNILLDEDKNAYLADFGIAKDLNVNDFTEDSDGKIIGSPAYMTPEQIQGGVVSPRSDIYSLGLVIYEMLVGRKPYDDVVTPYDLFNRHLNTPIPAVHLQRSNIPASLNEVLQTATAKEPANRYANVLRFAAAFRAADPAGYRTSSQPPTEPLIDRELDILQLMIEGLSNQEIAEKLFLSIATVKWYIKQIYHKLDVHNRYQALERARHLNLTRIPQHSAVVGKDRVQTVSDPTFILQEVLEPVNPYKGLRAFQEADAELFFGRAGLVEQLLSRLAEASTDARFLAVVGPSGSGKSSVVKAGLIPALRRNALANSGAWFITEMTPSSQPFKELEAALMRIAIGPQPDLLQQLTEDRRGLVRAARHLLPTDQHVDLLLVVDQFEELFTLVVDEATRTHFIDSILSAVTDSASRVRVIITLRADFYDRPLSYPRLAEIIRSHTEIVVPLRSTELERAILGPAEHAGLTLEPGLLSALINEVKEQPNALPLLQYALTELFERRTRLLLTLKAYEESGGILGALARRAETTYNDLDTTGQTVARHIFLRLINLGDGTEDTRRRAFQSELTNLDSEIEEVQEAFGRYRLLTFDRDPVNRSPTVEIAHEALIREWKRLRDWIDESRDLLQIQRRLMLATSEWEKNKRDVSFLASGIRLTQFETLAASKDLIQTQEEQSYISASIHERDKQMLAEQERRAAELNLQRRAARLLRYLVAVLLAASVIALGLAGFAMSREQVAVENAHIAEANANTATVAQGQALINAEVSENLRQAAEANSLIQAGNVELAALLSIRSLKTAYSFEGDSALQAAMRMPYSQRVFKGHTGQVWSVAFSPDGKYILTSGKDRAVRLWEASTGKEVRQFVHTHWVWAAAFSTDGKYIVTGTDIPGAFVQLWDVQSGKFLHNFSGHRADVLGVAFSPDGKYLLTASADTTARLWDVATGRSIKVFSGHTNTVTNAAFSSDGKYIVTSSWDKTARIWDATSGKELGQFVGHTDRVWNVAISPDGKHVLTGSDDNTARLWDTQSGKEVRQFLGHGATVMGVAFSPDGETVLTGSGDSAAKLWEIRTGRLLARFSAHTANVMKVAFSPDGSQILTGSWDSTARIWQVPQLQQPDQFSGHTSIVYSAAFSPDEKSVATGSGDRTIRLWDVATRTQVREFIGHTDIVQSVVFSPDGIAILSGSADGTARLWDVRTGKELKQFVGLSRTWILTAVFTPDGRYIFAGTNNPTGWIIIWDVQTGRRIGTISSPHTFNVLSIAFSPNNKYMLTGSADGTAIVWDVQRQQPINRLTGHSDWVVSVGFSPDGKYLLTGSVDNTVRLWDFQTAKEVLRMTGNYGAFSPDGVYIVTGGIDHLARLWNPITGTELRRLSGHTGSVQSVTFSPDGKYVLTASADNSAMIWESDYVSLINSACRKLTHDFTVEERIQWHIPESDATCPQFGTMLSPIPATSTLVATGTIPVFTPYPTVTLGSSPTPTPGIELPAFPTVPNQ
jgi:WD40 repeat protein/serine/threonine protein kinase